MGNLTLCDCYQIEIEFMHVDQTFEETQRKKTTEDREINDNGDVLLAEKKNTQENWRKWPTEPSTKGKLKAPRNHMIDVASHRACTDLGTQALLAVNSFKLHLTALKKFLQIFYF